MSDEEVGTNLFLFEGIGIVSEKSVCYNRNNADGKQDKTSGGSEMTVKFDVKMTEKAMYDFMLHTTYTSLNGIMGVILGGITLYLGIRQTMNGVYPAAATFFLIAIFFLVGTPLNMKAKSSEQVKKSPMFQKPITYELTEEGVQISQEDQSTLNEWGNFQKAVSTDTSIILYVTKVRALIFPKEALGEQYAAAVKMISTHMSPRKVKIRHVSAD